MKKLGQFLEKMKKKLRWGEFRSTRIKPKKKYDRKPQKKPPVLRDNEVSAKKTRRKLNKKDDK